MFIMRVFKFGNITKILFFCFKIFFIINFNFFSTAQLQKCKTFYCEPQRFQLYAQSKAKRIYKTTCMFTFNDSINNMANDIKNECCKKLAAAKTLNCAGSQYKRLHKPQTRTCIYLQIYTNIRIYNYNAALVLHMSTCHFSCVNNMTLMTCFSYCASWLQ